MKKSKILFLLQLPPPIHGASAVNKSIKDSELINSKFKTHYINISPAKDLADIGRMSPRKVLLFFRILGCSICAYMKFKPDLVYLTISPHGLAFYKDSIIALAIKTLGGRIVFHLHGKGIKKEAAKSKINETIYKLVFKNVDVIHLAETLFSDVDGVRDQSRSITAVANGINPINSSSATGKDGLFTFIYLSNLVRLKGADIVIRAATLIPEKYQDRFQVKIIGEKSSAKYASELDSIIKANPYNNVRLLGARYGDGKIKELTSSHVFILPTRNDCFPLAILEAMTAGLAVISTNEGAIPEIIDSGVAGDIIESCTPEKLADAMTKHIENPKYSALCAKASREKFEGCYTKKIFEQKLVSTLQTLVG